MPGSKFKEYLGDGVYASFDRYNIWLSTQQGHQIAIEPDVFDSLTDYRDNLSTRIANEQAQKQMLAPDLPVR